MKAVLLVAALGLAACSMPASTTSVLPGAQAGGTRGGSDLLGSAPLAPLGKLTLSLFDAPITRTPGLKVSVGIAGWQLLSPLGVSPFITHAKPEVVDLLTLKTAAKNEIGSAPLGTYTGVRLLIDTASSKVTIGAVSIPIIWGTPSAPSSSPVIAVDFPCYYTVTSAVGAGPKVSMDFNIFESARFRNGAIYLEPKVSAAAAAAQIHGHVANAAGTPVSDATVLATDAAGKVVNTTTTAGDGNFTIHAIAGGSYTIKVVNSYTTGAGETSTAVGADAGASPSVFVVVAPNENFNIPPNSLID